MLYHLVLAVLYGSPLNSGYPDSLWYIGTGLTIAGTKNAQSIPDQPPVLPLFIAWVYRLLGFPHFADYLWLWNVLTMGFLLTATYDVAYLLFNQKTAALATLLMGFNWHIGWYGQMLLVDVSVTAFAFTALLFYLRYLHSSNVKNLLLSGFFSSVALWTKMIATYLHLPVLLILLSNKSSRTKIHYFIAGFVLGQALLAPVCYLYGGNPLSPFTVSARVHGGTRIYAFLQGLQPSKPLIGIYNLYYLRLMPFSLGFPVLFFSILGIVRLLRQRALLLPVWALYGLAIYSLVIVPARDQYMVHFTPFFIILASIGLVKVIERFRLNKVSILVLVLLTFLFTNSARPLLFYSSSANNFVSPLLLHQRLGRNGLRNNQIIIVEELDLATDVTLRVGRFLATQYVRACYSIRVMLLTRSSLWLTPAMGSPLPASTATITPYPNKVL